MKRFQAALDRYGSDLDAWPRAEAERGRRMLLVSEEARQALDRLTRAGTPPRLRDGADRNGFRSWHRAWRSGDRCRGELRRSRSHGQRR